MVERVFAVQTLGITIEANGANSLAISKILRQTATEKVAITLATLNPNCHTIVSDTGTAIRNYIKGRISRQALRILHQVPHLPENQITVVWLPTHAGDDMSSSPTSTWSHAPLPEALSTMPETARAHP
ncbi:hypothetical protein HPB50_009388 [Hyalomma asiaticum]|uniref:Uncharacterized protein n=1 Tax=Hyalomma asiaticum TaxID=266040 RepID=A0ACB7T0M2_HYAAI|nr:hypothetical protein HPB50_009388 [Hyalomma asiaticum]